MRLTAYLSAMVLVLSGLTLQAQLDPIRGSEFAAALNVPSKNLKVEGRAFVPDSVQSLRAAIVFMTVGETPILFYEPSWQSLAAATNAALVVARVTYIAPPDGQVPVSGQPARNATGGGADALLTVLERLGTESGRKELANVPLAFWGWSAVASFGTTFAESWPEKTVAVVRFHTNRRGMDTNVSRLSEVPMLLLAGGKDTTAGTDDAEALWKEGRAVGAPWTLVVNPDATHGGVDPILKSNDMALSWMRSVLTQRVAGENRTLRRIMASPSNENWFPSDESRAAARLLSVGTK